jgi:tetraacyldisaccharide-1-P 4'-kinase
VYKDHHLFDMYDMENIRETFGHVKSDDKIIVTTEKDAVETVAASHLVFGK